MADGTPINVWGNTEDGYKLTSIKTAGLLRKKTWQQLDFANDCFKT